MMNVKIIKNCFFLLSSFYVLPFIFRIQNSREWMKNKIEIFGKFVHSFIEEKEKLNGDGDLPISGSETETDKPEFVDIIGKKYIKKSDLYSNSQPSDIFDNSLEQSHSTLKTNNPAVLFPLNVKISNVSKEEIVDREHYNKILSDMNFVINRGREIERGLKELKEAMCIGFFLTICFSYLFFIQL